MNTLLQIDSSIFGAGGQSSKLSKALVEGLKQDNEQLEVVHRDLSTTELPHFDSSTIGQISEGKAELADALIEELKQADTVVIGAPMYNFAVPTQLKAWFDHITRAGVTFKYTEQGPVGLLGKKKVIVITTSGGQHAGSSRDAVEPWLRTILNFIGLDQDLHFIRAEGLAQSALKDAAQEKARAEIDELVGALTE